MGLALSGGGSRGLAHVGVLRALQEQGLYPERIAGTSAGAIVGALYAGGYSPAEMLEFFQTKSPFRLSNLALKKPGIIDTAKVLEDFREYFPDNSFEALERDLAVVATDIASGKSVVFDSGPLIPAVLASSSVPIVFTPTEIDGRLFSDGGIIDNFPVGVLTGRCDVLIGAYVNPLRHLDEEDVDSSFTVLQRAFEIAAWMASKVKFDRCDVLVCPPELARYSTFDTKHLEEIEEIGYVAAVAVMDDILRLVGRAAVS